MADQKKITPQRPGAGADDVPLSRVTEGPAGTRDSLKKTALRKSMLRKAMLRKAFRKSL